MYNFIVRFGPLDPSFWYDFIVVNQAVLVELKFKVLTPERLFYYNPPVLACAGYLPHPP